MSLLLFKALADETRLRLVNILFHYELSVNELVRILGMGQSRVSRHLKILAEAGLLKSRRDGLWVFYSAPTAGDRLDFLKAVMPFVPENEAGDLHLAARVLEERALKARQFFNAIADNWDDLNREVLGDFDLAAHVRAAVPPGCSVAADLGCGTGLVLAALLSSVQMAIGVDGSARMLEMCRMRMGANELAAGHASLRIGELSHLPLADHEAGFACLNLVLHHLPRLEDVFPEIQRVIAPGGILFLADFLRHDDETMRSRYGDHWLGFDPGELEPVLAKSGFKVHHIDFQPVNRGLRLFLLQAERLSA